MEGGGGEGLMIYENERRGKMGVLSGWIGRGGRVELD